LTGVVIDSSALIAFLFPDETLSPDEAARIQEDDLFAPSLIALEVTNTALMALRRKRLELGDIHTIMDAFRDLALSVDSDAKPARIFALAARQNLTAYDATYLELALRLNLPLLTRDKALAAAARAEGVPG
jgi:predicted nucleic acid-binding protein